MRTMSQKRIRDERKIVFLRLQLRIMLMWKIAHTKMNKLRQYKVKGQGVLLVKGEREPVDVVMSNQPEQFAESCPEDQVRESFAILLEDETDEESPKGRGQKKRRKGKVLRTPWTNPLKRRKFKNLTVFDLFREVDLAKVSDLNEWMEKASPRDVVALAICDAGRKFFEDLRDQSGWLTGDHYFISESEQLNMQTFFDKTALFSTLISGNLSKMPTITG
ncbi:Ulp1 protease family protein [Forsythia ovata]|uniref:Ulp1 protease family protein n=1 Tax=Forsythia ovata TaxID=205694 RepID=A0ABD1VIH6_9LAMI